MTKGLTPLSANRCFPDTGKCGRGPLNQSSLIALITLPNLETWHRIEYPFLNILTDSFVVLIMVLLLRSSFKGMVMSIYSSSAASMPLTSHDFCIRPAYLHIYPHIVDFANPYSLRMFFSAFTANTVSQDRFWIPLDICCSPCSNLHSTHYLKFEQVCRLRIFFTLTLILGIDCLIFGEVALFSLPVLEEGNLSKARTSNKKHELTPRRNTCRGS